MAVGKVLVSDCGDREVDRRSGALCCADCGRCLSVRTCLLVSSHRGKLFQTIETYKEQEHISNYSMGHTTLDQVFVNVCQGVDKENSQAVRRGGLISRMVGRTK